MAMKAVQGELQAVFSHALRTAFPQLPRQEPIINAAQPRFGDYQMNNAMGLFKDYGKQVGATAQAVGEKIKENLPASPMIESVSVAPAGFVTVKLSNAWVAEQIGLVASAKGIAVNDPTPQRVAVDFSSPNIAKEMHVGHLRSTIIGDSLCRILEFAGHEVLRLNHVGDWGTQFGMLIEYMRDEYPEFQSKPPPIADLQEFYKLARKKFEADEEFKKRSQLAVVSLQAGDKFCRAAWGLICNISRQSFQVIYDRLGITLVERGESYYNEMIPPLVASLESRDVIEESNGAKCIFTKASQVPLMVVKADGGYGYDSTDLAAVFHRLMVERCDWVVYITDLGQETHFFNVFAGAERAGWHRSGCTRLDHMGFGLVLGEDGKKFKTRSGDTVKLENLLDEAAERAKQTLKQRAGEGDEDEKSKTYLSEADFEEASKIVGYGAVKYSDLKNSRTTDYCFSYDKMLDPKGDTAVYLLYAYARICNIFAKGSIPLGQVDAAKCKVTNDKERELMLSILRFPDVIQQVLQHLHISYLAEYVYKLCTTLASFYTDKNCKVLDVKNGTADPSRLVILEAARKVLKQGLFLLGIQTLDKL
jgi:arginyl-tRNA synthetase